MRTAVSIAAFLGVFVAAGCDACSSHDSAARPKLGAGANKKPTAAPEATPPAEEPEGHGGALPAGTRRVSIEGATVEIATGEIRALRAFDADDDGDRDALLVMFQGEQMGVLFARRAQDKFEPPAVIDRATPVGTGCKLSEARIDRVGESFWQAAATCGESGEMTYWLLDGSSPPRLGERIAVLPAVAPTDPKIALGARALDADGDGHGDIAVDMSLSWSDSTAKVTFNWVDRPSGLARTLTEPDATLTSLASAARDAKEPAEALRTARSVSMVWDAFCRDKQSKPRVRFGTGRGLPCAAVSARDETNALLASDLARAGDIPRALALYDSLPVNIRSREAEPFGAALRSSPRSVVAHATEGPPVGAGPASPVHLSRLAFAGPGTVLIRSEPPKLFDIAAATVSDAPPEGGSTVVLEPSGKRAVVDVTRNCAGDELVIADRASIVAGVLVGRPTAQPLLEPATVPDPTCAGPEHGTSISDWRILGWSPQGIVAAQPGRVRVVPSNASGAFDEAYDLPSTPLPAPLSAGLVSPSGAYLVIPLQIGALVLQGSLLSVSTFVEFDAGWAGDGVPEDVAVSDDGQSLVFLRNGHLWVAQIAR